MTMLEQMVETKSWKASRGLAECSQCRLCSQQKETVEHLWMDENCWHIASV